VTFDEPLGVVAVFLAVEELRAGEHAEIGDCVSGVRALTAALEDPACR
jgi:hypothetical protein